jgi:hypothetical protein
MTNKPRKSTNAAIGCSGRLVLLGASRSLNAPRFPEESDLAKVVFPHCLGSGKATMGLRLKENNITCLIIDRITSTVVII